MPPKARITRQGILEAALALVREKGEDALNARDLAAALGCSTQPLFSNFDSMEQLRLAVIQQAEQVYTQYSEQELARGEYPPYKASGMAYIQFAREEKKLFQLLYMRDRRGEEPEESALYAQMQALICQSTGASIQQAQLLHLEMWAFVHGIAAMEATGYLELPAELVSSMLTDVYQGLRHSLLGG